MLSNFISTTLLTEISKWHHSCTVPQKRHRRQSLYFIPNLGTQEADFPDRDVKSHAMYPNQEFCIHGHLYVSDGNKYTTACYMQFSSKTFSFIRASLFPCSCYLLLPYSMSWHLGEGTKHINPLLSLQRGYQKGQHPRAALRASERTRQQISSPRKQRCQNSLPGAC